MYGLKKYFGWYKITTLFILILSEMLYAIIAVNTFVKDYYSKIPMQSPSGNLILGFSIGGLITLAICIILTICIYFWARHCNKTDKYY